MKKPFQVVDKKKQERAKMGALLTIDKSYSMQRLLKDYNELKNQIIPVQGVSAAPLDDNLYKWHANVKALADNPYKNMVLHLELNFPRDYPINPPTIKMLKNGSMEHPSIMAGDQICLDMLTSLALNKNTGWTSSYSIVSILMQLQSFFFDLPGDYFDKKGKNNYMDILRNINEYNCNCCGHKGSAGPYPELPVLKLEDLQMTEDKLKTLQKNQIICFQRKTYLDEAPLGVGVSTVILPRTQEITKVVPILDLLSLKSFIKGRVRSSINGTRFTHWFPIYFGVNKDQFIKLATRAISMMCVNNTRKFDPVQIFKIAPKILNGLIVDIMSEKTNTSNKSLKMMVWLYRSLRMLIDEYPIVEEMFDEKISQFMTDHSNRLKENCNSLGDLLCYVIFSRKYSLRDIVNAYIDEQMDRQVFWIIQLIPEIEKLIDNDKIDSARSKVCFKAGAIGNQILLFYNYFERTILSSDIDSTTKTLDANYGNFEDNDLSIFTQGTRALLKVDSFEQYYSILGLQSPSEDEINEKLKNSFKSSAAKGYHGDDKIRFVPNETEQINYWFTRYPKPTEIIKDDKLLGEDEIDWKSLLLTKFDRVKRILAIYPAFDMTPSNLIKKYNEMFVDYIFSNASSFKTKNIHLDYHFEENKVSIKDMNSSIFDTFTWREVYVKIFFEEYFRFFPSKCDFQEYYFYLTAMAPHIKHFNLILQSCKLLKSDFNYVRVFLSKLPAIKSINLFLLEGYKEKLFKNIVKGINNLVLINTDIVSYKVWTATGYLVNGTKDLNILTPIEKMANLKQVDLSGTPFDQHAAIKLRNHLYYFRTIEVLNLSRCRLGDPAAKEIADGLMKAKSLEHIDISYNSFQTGVDSIIYNLSFQPNVKFVNISDNYSVQANGLATAIYKLVKMSQSLEFLLASRISTLIPALKEEFYVSLADNSNIKYVDLSGSGVFNTTTIQWLASSIAFNAMKNGSLSKLFINGCFDANYTTFTSFVDGLSINEFMHLKWFESQFNPNIVKESTEYYKKIFYNNLTELGLGRIYLTPTFSVFDPKKPDLQNHLRTLLKWSHKLTSIDFHNVTLNKFFLEMIHQALKDNNNLQKLRLRNCKITGELFKSFIPLFGEPNSPNPKCHLKVLDLSDNNLGYSGIFSLSKVLTYNNTLKTLNLYKTKFDVNGARRLAEGLSQNNTIEELDIGYNRAKNLGVTNIVNSVLKNPNNKVSYLNLKYNFVRENEMIELVKEIGSNANSHINKIELGNNTFTQLAAKEAFNVYQNGRKFDIDIFEIVYWTEPERLERTVWLSPLSFGTAPALIIGQIKAKEFELVKRENCHVGIPMFLSIKRGRKWGEKKTNNLVDCFVEFIMPNSTNRLLKIASSEGFHVNGKKVRVFKSGTKPERLFLKRKKI